jgi:hypothetical protein
VLGVKLGASEAEPFWTDFLRRLNRRGLRSVKLMVSDSHEGLKAAAAKVLKATWQRCRVHYADLGSWRDLLRTARSPPDDSMDGMPCSPYDQNDRRLHRRVCENGEDSVHLRSWLPTIMASTAGLTLPLATHGVPAATGTLVASAPASSVDASAAVLSADPLMRGWLLAFAAVVAGVFALGAVLLAFVGTFQARRRGLRYLGYWGGFGGSGSGWQVSPAAVSLVAAALLAGAAVAVISSLLQTTDPRPAAKAPETADKSDKKSASATH